MRKLRFRRTGEGGCPHVASGGVGFLNERGARAHMNSASYLGVVLSSKLVRKFSENGLPGNAVGTKTNEFNCYHSSHFQR